MTIADAKEWVAFNDDNFDLDRDDLVAAWEALYGRALADDDDDDTGRLWSDCVLASEAEPAHAD